MSSVGKRHRGTAGFALIEVLVAVLLFAIGILGMVGLQASMTQAQTESKVRADAANLDRRAGHGDVGVNSANRPSRPWLADLQHRLDARATPRAMRG